MSRTVLLVPVLGLAAALVSRPSVAQCTTPVPVTPASCAAAATYNAQTGGVSLLVWVDGQVVCEDYRTGGGPTIFHEIWSGTKSFWGPIAAAAIEDGIIASLDERVADTITEWQADDRKSRITVRHLLSLTAGLQANGAGGGAPTYAEAIALPALYEPGTVWEYGATPYQCFGEFLRRKLAGSYRDPVEYLQARFLDHIGASYSEWSYGTDGYPLLPQGSRWLAREWVKYGEMVRLGGAWAATGQQVVSQELLDASFHGSAVKPDYGLTFWLPTPGEPGKPCDTLMPRGLGTQNMYIIRSLRLVAVRQTNDPWDGLNFSDNVFLDTLLDPPAPQDDCAPAEALHLAVDRAGEDLRFDWDPVHRDLIGKVDLLAGYDLEEATRPDFSDGQVHTQTAGPTSAVTVPLGGGSQPEILFYRIRARDKCGNVGP